MDISKRKQIVDDEQEHIFSSVHITSGDLLVDILLRLPLFTVLRFQRVCKQWYSLISNPVFLQTHSSSSSFTSDQLLVCKSKSNLRPCNGHVEILNVPYNRPLDDEPQLVYELSLPVNLLSYHLVDSCNGLLLLRCILVADTINKDDEDITSKNIYYVYNPMTNHYLKLPGMIPIPNIQVDEQLLVENRIHSRHASLVFDPSISHSYKIIRYLRRQSSCRDIDRHWQMYVYSSKTAGSWRLLSARIPDPMGTIEFGFKSVLLDGVLYWSYWLTKGDELVCFDVEKECVWFLALPLKPQDFSGTRNCLYFGECGGRLRMIETFLNCNIKSGWHDSINHLPDCFDVNEAEPQQYQQRLSAPRYTWTVKYHVDVRSVDDYCPSVIHFYKTKNRRGTEAEPENEEEEEVLLLKLNNRTIVSLNVTSNKFKNELIPIPESICLSDFIDVFAYKPICFLFHSR